MFGGGVFVTQNKELPGSYINFVSTDTLSTGFLGERGVVAMVYSLKSAPSDSPAVITITKSEFLMDAKSILGVDYDDPSMKPIREIFRHANKVHLYNKSATGFTLANALTTLESYEFNVLAAYTGDSSEIDTYIEKVKTWREDYGKKCQLVVYNSPDTDYEGVISVKNKVVDSGEEAFALVPWVAGAQAGCQVNASCTNMVYDGEYAVDTVYSQSDLETALNDGEFVFHLAYDDVRVLEDINTFTTFTVAKSEDFRYNQTIRVLDQIANDIAKLFNTKYIGKIPNDESGRTSFWADIVAHHKELQTMRAITDFSSGSVKVMAGATKRAIVVEDAVTPVNAMSQLYMTVYVN